MNKQIWLEGLGTLEFEFSNGGIRCVLTTCSMTLYGAARSTREDALEVFHQYFITRLHEECNSVESGK